MMILTVLSALMYPRIKSNPGKVHPESNIYCPLGELSLVDIANKKTTTYKKSVPRIVVTLSF